MNAYPIGNDLTVKWSLLYSDGSVFPLSNYDYELSYRTNRGNKVVTDTSVISVDENILTWTFKGDEQVVSGRYTICLKITLSGSKVVELQYDNAFMLSPLSGFKGAGSEIVLQSYCDAIDLKDAVLQARKAMDLAGSAVNTAGGAETTANEAKTIASTANNTSTEAKTIASNAKTVADQAKATADATAATATQKAEEVAQKEAQLEAALNNLSTDQSGALALSTKVNEHGAKLSELEGEITDVTGKPAHEETDTISILSPGSYQYGSSVFDFPLLETYKIIVRLDLGQQTSFPTLPIVQIDNSDNRLDEGNGGTYDSTTGEGFFDYTPSTTGEHTIKVYSSSKSYNFNITISRHVEAQKGALDDISNTIAKLENKVFGNLRKESFSYSVSGAIPSGTILGTLSKPIKKGKSFFVFCNNASVLKSISLYAKKNDGSAAYMYGYSGTKRTSFTLEISLNIFSVMLLADDEICSFTIYTPASSIVGTGTIQVDIYEANPGINFSSLLASHNDKEFLNICYSSISNTLYPNTIAHFSYAVEQGYKALKADARICADGKLICCHDDFYRINSDGKLMLSSSSDTPTPIISKTLEEWLSYETFLGNHPCSVEEFLIFCKKKGITPYVTLRSEDGETAAQELDRLFVKYSLSDVAIYNIHPDRADAILYLKKLGVRTPMCYTLSTSNRLNEPLCIMLETLGVVYVCLGVGTYEEKDIEMAHAHGLRILVCNESNPNLLEGYLITGVVGSQTASYTLPGW